MTPIPPLLQLKEEKEPQKKWCDLIRVEKQKTTANIMTS